MQVGKDENSGVSGDSVQEGFALGLASDEIRRQVWACAALSGIILAALLASLFSGTS